MHPQPSLLQQFENPLQIDVMRGKAVESQHLVDIALCDGQGRLMLSYGNAEAVIFPRSAIKPLQALAVIDALSKAGELESLSDEEIAVLCASHNGEQKHVDIVGKLLDRFGISHDRLVCGAHWSLHQPTLISQVRERNLPDKIYNNCSGKHAGMLILAHLSGHDTDQYGDWQHPVQRRMIQIMNQLTECDILSFPHGIDGCGAPAYSAPLRSWARAFALFAGGGTLEGWLADGCRTLSQAIARAPFMIAGSGRCCSAVNQAYAGEITVKVGAEGVYGIAFNSLGLGGMLKVRDGNTRAAEAGLGHLLSALGISQPEELSEFFAPTLNNWAGTQVGRIAVATSQIKKDSHQNK